jgi:hypothetical protein
MQQLSCDVLGEILGTHGSSAAQEQGVDDTDDGSGSGVDGTSLGLESAERTRI